MSGPRGLILLPVLAVLDPGAATVSTPAETGVEAVLGRSVPTEREDCSELDAIGGYRVHIGWDRRHIHDHIAVGNFASYTVVGLEPGRTHLSACDRGLPAAAVAVRGP